MAGNSVVVDSATQTPDFEDDDEHMFALQDMPNASPRVVIDTSAPFRSVEEAVVRFGGRGFWVPGSILALDAASTDQRETEVSDINKLEERTVAMLKDLQLKEEETHDILKELDLTKRLVEELKLKLSNESPEFKSSEHSSKDSADSIKTQTLKPAEHSETYNLSASGLIMSELRQAKLNLYQNTHELAAIRASVESLSNKLEMEKQSQNPSNFLQNNVGKSSVTPLVISRELRELNYEADQFMKTAEEAKSEVVRAMSEIEQTKTGLKVIEMRWLTAKKLEEAARAAESLALAEIRALSSHTDGIPEKPRRISLTLEEYSALTDKARKAERLLKRNPTPLATRRDSRLLDLNEFEFVRNEQPRPRTRPTTSIGEILSRKLVMRDDLEVGRRNEEGTEGRQRVSLNQMLSRHRGEGSPQRRREKNVDEQKGLFSKRKGLGLVHISFPLSKHGKNKIQALNLW
ncbi:hypothetical protein RND81_10G153500 [Saponaria officinalis]|uniref:WEB family protein n=1 Tax=Saponaria officinalis TaxID=3572 RepID=A0AAW1I213_SAPOF